MMLCDVASLLQDIEEEMMFGGDAERAYALSVEQNNGRWAMIVSNKTHCLSHMHA
jgi:hypothetical protein